MNTTLIGTYIVLAVLRLIARLPFCILYTLSDVLRFFMQHVFRYREKVILGNLTRSFPEKNDIEIRCIASLYYKHLCDCIVESVKLLYISDGQLEQRITVNGGEYIDKLASDGRPIIVFLGHYGNWEWVQEVSRHYRHPAINAEIYRPMKNKIMDNVMLAIRARFHTHPIRQKHVIRQLIRMNREGKQFIVGVIADQRPNSKNLHHWTTFLNQDTAYAIGGEELGRHVDAHFVYLDIKKPYRGRYVMTFKPIFIEGLQDEDYPYTKKFLLMMEETIYHAPQYWLWSHNRWKYDRQGNIIHK